MNITPQNIKLLCEKSKWKKGDVDLSFGMHLLFQVLTEKVREETSWKEGYIHNYKPNQSIEGAKTSSEVLW